MVVIFRMWEHTEYGQWLLRFFRCGFTKVTFSANVTRLQRHHRVVFHTNSRGYKELDAYVNANCFIGSIFHTPSL